MPPLLLLLLLTSSLHFLSPSSAATIAEFQEPIGPLIVHPLLQFLDGTNSSFLINLHPYHILKINSEIPIEFVLFQTNPFNFRDDVTGARHRNLFDVTVDAIIAAMAASGKENVPVILAETGWPTGSEAEDAGNYAEMYLRGLITHLRSGSGSGTPLFNEGIQRGTISSSNGTRSDAAAGEWGILYPNMTMKYRFRFSDGIRCIIRGWLDFLL
ncbi:glucan endo-1,3-beta-glucosidase, acidic-like [Salvia splendens]|uniref:glucan endo-1,3-beta-glucosidase, acidic-like n=1 Tax=Salvia splendens TaxID=180675 RepID=UPI001C262791|nr:glucan endo-1,3-beta-glucosidase, acidic-like [Salvia splendens]